MLKIAFHVAALLPKHHAKDQNTLMEQYIIHICQHIDGSAM